MNYKQTIETLDNLHTRLEEQLKSAIKFMEDKNYKKAGETLTKGLAEADREVKLAKQEEFLVSSGLPQENIPVQEVLDAYARIEQQVKALKNKKSVCDTNHSIQQFSQEQQEAIERRQTVAQKRTVAQQYERSFAQLFALSKQPEPFVGVKDELSLFLKQVKQMQANNSATTTELTRVMNITYDRLTGGSSERFDKMVNNLDSKQSVSLKLLGTTLALLGAALVAAAVFFAPVVLAAAGVGVGTACLLTGAVTVASSALSIGGASCFFAKTEKMKLAEADKELGNHNFEESHYNSAAVGA